MQQASRKASFFGARAIREMEAQEDAEEAAEADRVEHGMGGRTQSMLLAANQYLGAPRQMGRDGRSAAGGAIVAGLMSYSFDGLQDLSSMSNGILAGLVSITAPCSATEPWAALVIGMIGGVVYYFACKLLDKLEVDDVVLAIPVHCFW